MTRSRPADCLPRRKAKPSHWTAARLGLGSLHSVRKTCPDCGDQRFSRSPVELRNDISCLSCKSALIVAPRAIAGSTPAKLRRQKWLHGGLGSARVHPFREE